MRLIIDCDPGNGIAGANVDDGLALALAIAAPQISLELISTVSGNTPSEIGYSVAKSLLQKLGENIPVLRGASQGFLEPMNIWREKLDYGVDQNGLRDLWEYVAPPKQFPIVAPSASQGMGELVCRNPGEVTLVAIGPLTNVAHAMQLYPEFAKSVAEIVIMGGVFNVPGYQKDTNFGIDPEAAHLVLTSGANITLVPMDVTTQTQMLHSDLDYLSTFNNPLCKFLVDTIRPWMNYSIKTRGLEGCWIHDALTVAWLIDRTIVTSTQNYVDVVLEGADRGMTCFYEPESASFNINVSNKINPITILNTVESDRFLSMIFHYIQNY
ncbi:nucleoside hydrolase [Xenorhabdus bovienii]|uniref:Inosine-uridine preferring nucleoside hydrolase n=2 Tax=Xenorhabdus bovienii TaxID=40576 RepID=A0A077Q610_XENBV|nr:nucleoside hydrolase [Xenorhabdus bovienii]MDE1476902.1 nucleoside hydrolase [Xenorhabdus bovienii]MDE1481912.1 nucleoside hydrolase [Xenorhabdus bovienii]MDE1490782.1 nucleoside hydrolase [Xenorhabdus bovienii]MDE9481740.1 nucleoside hydrolase [Xenorhabdus bovienii]MDE9508653.1 nucleoside hydrolase [Xenorhabdus bovienii]